MHACRDLSAQPVRAGAALRRRPRAAAPVRKALAGLLLALAALPSAHAQVSGSQFLGQMILVPYNFCPRGWTEANGLLMAINTNQALFSLLGTTYGGNGVTNFALPDLRGRAPIHTGTLLGGGGYALGQFGGNESVTLTPSHLPQHAHTMPASSAAATHAAPGAGRVLGVTQNAGSYVAGTGDTFMGFTGPAGGSTSVDVRSPYLTMRWCIAFEGIFPSQN